MTISHNARAKRGGREHIGREKGPSSNSIPSKNSMAILWPTHSPLSLYASQLKSCDWKLQTAVGRDAGIVHTNKTSKRKNKLSLIDTFLDVCSFIRIIMCFFRCSSAPLFMFSHSRSLCHLSIFSFHNIFYSYFANVPLS